MLRSFPTILILIVFCLAGRAQDAPTLLQVAGFIMEKDSKEPLPYAHILNPNKNIGKVADASGYFHVIASPGDTIVFSSVGFVTQKYVVSERETQLSILMEFDVVQLPETQVGPWPKNLLILKEEIRNKEVVTAASILEKNMEKAGFKPPPTHPTPPPPSILNPISFIYEKIFKKIQEKQPKTDQIEVLPELPDLE